MQLEALDSGSGLIEVTQHLILNDLIVPGESLLDVDGETLPNDIAGEPAFLLVRDPEFGERLSIGPDDKHLLRFSHCHSPVVLVKT
jgi:hypothetical protein